MRALGRQLSDLFDAHDLSWYANEYAAIAMAAARCLSDGCDQADLNKLSAMGSPGPVWVDARAAAHLSLRRVGWMEDAARMTRQFRRAMVELRVVADTSEPNP